MAIMNIWIDLANSPQVHFFRPIVAELQRRGHRTIITTRHYAQTIELADQVGFVHQPIGGHAGEKGLAASLWVNWRRSREQISYLSPQRIDLAISHNSYAQAMAAAFKRWPFATAMDYEHQKGNHLPFRVAQMVIVPEAFPDKLLKTYGARRVYKYPGVKEQIYLADFQPNPEFCRSLPFDASRIIVLLRPPATWAMYHQGFENQIFGQLLLNLGNRPDVQLIFIPRIAAQRNAVAELKLPNIWIPTIALDGPNLIYAADVVISAGGTMNREAAVLGTPAYTVFAGELGAVDDYLIGHRRMYALTKIEDLQVVKKSAANMPPILDASKLLVQSVTDAFLSAAEA
jgi:uncharacterized protein